MKLRALDVAPGTQPPDGVHARTHRYCICTPSSSTRSVPCLQYKKTTPFCDVKYIDLFCSIRVLKGNGGAPRCKRRPALAQHACMQLCGCATRPPPARGCLWHSLRSLNIFAFICARPSCAQSQGDGRTGTCVCSYGAVGKFVKRRLFKKTLCV